MNSYTELFLAIVLLRYSVNAISIEKKANKFQAQQSNTVHDVDIFIPADSDFWLNSFHECFSFHQLRYMHHLV